MRTTLCLIVLAAVLVVRPATAQSDSSDNGKNHYILCDPKCAEVLPCEQECPTEWVAVAPMHVGRVGHTATLLGDGTVLVAGGESRHALASPDAVVLASTEIYDPRSNMWRFAAPMRIPRQRHTATLLSDGTVLLVGGSTSGTFLSDADIYDPRSDTWRRAASMSVARAGHSATLLGNGKVLVAGGAVGSDRSAELYDPVSDTWTSAGTLAVQHAFHTATLLSDGRVLVAGGAAFNYPTDLTEPVRNAEIYDPTSNTWSVAGMIDVRQPHLWWATATALPSGTVMVAGGGDPTDWVLDDVNFYNPAADAWNRGASLSTVRIMHSATLLPDGKVLIVGGFDYTGVLGSTEVYDPASGESAPSNDLVTGRAMHAATLLSDGAVLVTGGVGNDYGTLAASEIFVPRTRQSHP